MKVCMEKLDYLDAEHELMLATKEDLPDEFRGDVWNERTNDDDEIIETWYVGEKVISYEGKEMTLSEWENYLNEFPKEVNNLVELRS